MVHKTTGRIVGRDFGADHQRQTIFLGGGVRPHHAGQRVAVGDGQRLIAQGDGPGHQFVGMRSSFEKRKVRFAMQFGVGQGDRAGRRHGRARKLASVGGWNFGHGGSFPGNDWPAPFEVASHD